MHKQEEQNEYIPISPRMLRPGSRGRFDLYLLRGSSYVLYNSRKTTITSDKIQDLQTSNSTGLFISAKKAHYYQHYIREHIADIVEDDTVPLQERAQAWSNTASQMGKEMFEENLPGPAFTKRCERFTQLVQETSGFLQCPQSLKALSSFISKGYESYHHGVSTMVYAVCLMQEFENDDYEVLACGLGAMLHDIGRSTLPKEIQRKDPAAMTNDEQEILAIHPMISVRICNSFNLPPAATNAILFHHEREDGHGYPTQASGDQMPLHTKIVALCNIYDNLTRTQPYRKAMLPFEALKEISEDEGAVNKGVLAKFIRMLSTAEIV